MKRQIISIFLGVLVVMMTSLSAIAAGGEDEKNGGFVPVSLVEKAAKFYAEERWPGSTMFSMTPYFALDGSINAYAVQFVKEGSSFVNEAELAEKIALAEEQEKIVLQNRPRRKNAEGFEGNNASSEVSITRIEGDRAEVSAYLPPGFLDQSQGPGGESEQKAMEEWREERKAAGNATVLTGQIGTVIIAASYDLYPLLERFDGVAPHLKNESKVRELAGISEKGQKCIERTYYLGPMAYFHEVLITSEQEGKTRRKIINRRSSQILDVEDMAITLGTGRLAPAPAEKLPISPQTFWDAIDQQGAPPKTGGDIPPGGSSHSIPGVPYYHQDDYGAASCGPTASAQAVAYWDDRGYGNLVDNGSSISGHEEELIYNLMRAEDYSPTVGTYGSEIEPGIEAVCNNNEYGNNLNFNVISDYSVSWTDDIKAEINAHRPFVYFNWDGSKYPYWAHFTTGTGYNDDSGHKLFVHYNYPPDTPFELNWDNIPSNNEAIYKVNPVSTPFDCVWSEDFEGLFPGPWVVGSSGPTVAYWDDTSYRAHNITPDPSPPGGNSTWSGYCVDSHIAPPGPYPNSLNAWMVYGPFSTVGKTSGEVSAFIWTYMPDNIDWVGLLASTNGTNFGGTGWSGDYRYWDRVTLNLSGVMNQPQVWVAVWFQSNASSTAEGAYVDDITIKLSCCNRDLIVQNIAATPTIPLPGQTVSVNVPFRNQGSLAAEYFYVDFYKHRNTAPGPHQWGDFYCWVENLAQGDTATCTGNVSYASEGSYKMWAQIDTDQAVAESNESNNILGPLTIKVDGNPPTGTISINGGATYATSTSVTLTLSCSDTGSGCYQMRFSNDNVTFTSWEAYATSKAWTLAGGDGTKTVYVQFKDNAGFSSGSFSDSIILCTTPPPAATLISPTGDITDNTPTYRWNAVSNSFWYYLWVNDSTGNKIKQWYSAASAGCASGTGECSVTPGIAVAYGNAMWWIETWNPAGYGPWSSGMSFTVIATEPPTAATLVSPSGTTTDTTPTYTWNAVSNSTWYCLYVNDSTGNKINQWYTAAQAGCASGTGTCSVTPTTEVRGSSQWWVRTYNSAGLGPWSASLSFTVTPPPAATQVSPTGTITDTTPAYIWNAVSSSTWYCLYVNDSTGNKINQWYTAAQAGCASGTGTCSVTPTTEVRGSSQWWVRTYNSAGLGPWSTGLSFTAPALTTPPGAATQIAPSGTITDTTPTYTWNPPASGPTAPTWYCLYVNDSTGNRINQWYPAADAGCADGVGTCSVTPTTVLAMGAGSWWIRTYNSGGFGPWSTGMSFTVSR